MNTTRRVALLTGAAVVAALPLAPASAESSNGTTYHGSWVTGTNELCETSEASGPWSVLMKTDGTANVSSTVLLDGKLHAAWGGLEFNVVKWKGDSFTLSYGTTTLVLKGDTITFYIPDRYDCGDAVLSGTLTH